MGTFIDAAETTYPKTYHGGNEIIPLEGASMLPILTNTDTELHEYIFGEHFDNCVVWWKNWKAVKDQNSKVWELFNLEKDRTERVDLSRENPKILKQLVDEWNKWANTHYVYPKGK